MAMKAKGSKKIGRDLAKCKRYAMRWSRWHNKRKRILQSNGESAAKVYPRKHSKRYEARHG